MTYLLSVIIPVYNEELNLLELHNSLQSCLEPYSNSFEILFINDGSTDNSLQILKSIASENTDAKVISFRRNFGQTAAMDAGIKNAEGKIIVFMDADLQNDPSDIPVMIDKLNEGYDVVSGWRRDRKDKFLTKRLPSRIANSLIRFFSKVNIHDLGCSLKVYRREIIEEISLYGEMHRFVPIIAARLGAKITEVEVKHHPRKHGKSNYGLSRTYKVLLDLITVQFMSSFSTKPIYLYGGFAFLSLFLGFVSGSALILMKLFWEIDMTGNPMLLLTVLFALITILLMLMGIQAEVLTRIYHQQGRAKHYFVKETVNITKAKN